jgi:hypothetical protein
VGGSPVADRRVTTLLKNWFRAQVVPHAERSILSVDEGDLGWMLASAS